MGNLWGNALVIHFLSNFPKNSAGCPVDPHTNLPLCFFPPALQYISHPIGIFFPFQQRPGSCVITFHNHNSSWLAPHFPALCQKTERQYVLFLFCWVSWEIESLVSLPLFSDHIPFKASIVPSSFPVIWVLDASSWKQPALAQGRRCKWSDGEIVAEGNGEKGVEDK